MNNKRRYTTQEVIDFVTDGNQSDMSEFSSDDDDDEFVPENNQETLNIPTDGTLHYSNNNFLFPGHF